MINRLKQRVERREEGFTLIELLIVIVVLGILAAIVVFALSNQTSNAARAACNADAKSVEVAVEAYRAQNGTYPTDIATNLVPGYIRQAPALITGTFAAPTLPAGQKYGVNVGGTFGGVAGKVYVISNAGAMIDYDAQVATTGCSIVN